VLPHAAPCSLRHAPGALATAATRARAARRFAVDLGKGHDLRGALLKLEEVNKASLNVDALYSAYHHSHPHLVERLAAIDGTLATKRRKDS
jgi:Zn-dependent protease with chaperone function